MTDGTRFDQLPRFMQEAASAYYEAYVSGIDRQAELAEGEFMAMAAELSGYVDNMVDYMDANSEFTELIKRFDELQSMPLTLDSIDELNHLAPLINEYISAYNALTDTPDDDLPVLGES